MADEPRITTVEAPAGDARQVIVYGDVAVDGTASPDSLTYLGWKAFAGCDRLRRVSVPAGLDPHTHFVELYGGCPPSSVRIRRY